jgi:hypothetical protein
VNNLGVKSAYVTANVTASGDETAPAAAASLTATPQANSVVLTWTNPSDADFSHMTVRQKQSGGSWTTAASVSGGKNEFETFTVGNVVGGTTYYYAIRSVDYSGNVSAYVYSAAVVPLSPETRAPRASHGYVYWDYLVTNPPATPTATSYNYDTNTFGGLTTHWQMDPPSVSVSTTDRYAASFTITENSYDGTQTIVFSLVSFTNLSNTLADPNTTNITTIDGGLIKTGKVEADRIQIDDVTLDTQVIGGVPTLIIKTAGVDTIQIQDNAVTIPVISNTTSTVYEHFTDPEHSGSTLGNTTKTIGLRTFRQPVIGSTPCTLTAQQLNINITSSNTPVLITFTGSILTNMRGPAGGENFIYFELLRGNTVIKSFFHGEPASVAGFTDLEDNELNSGIERQLWLERRGLLLNMSHIDESASQGSQTYKLRYRWLAEDTSPNFDNHHSLRNNCTMMAVELQK